jgi:hypothetical protein
LSGRHGLSGRNFLSGILLATAVAVPAAAQDRVIGLLALPEVYGARQCAPFEPRDVPLHALPNDRQAVAVIRVDRNWSFAPHGGCEGLEVSVHRGQERYQLPTLEYDYEMPAAIVLEQRSGWFRIRLDKDSAWVQASPVDRFLSLDQLFEEFIGVTSVRAPFSGRLVVAPGRKPDAASPSVTGGQSARVIEIRNVFGETWVQVEIASHSLCDAGAKGPPEIIGEGWMPLYDTKGEPAVWYSSRGC